MDNNKIQPELPKTSTLIKESISIYKEKFGAIIATLIAPIIGIIIIGFIVGFFTASNQPDAKLILLMISIILLMLLSSYIALLYLIAKRKENISVIESYKIGIKKIHSFVWISILSGIAIIIGLMFFIVPGIIVSIWISLSVYILISEDKKGTDALKASKSYIKGVWRPLAKRIYSATLYILGITLLLSIPLVFFEKGGVAVTIISILIDVVIMFILMPIAVIFMFLLYENVKSLKQNSS